MYIYVLKFEIGVCQSTRLNIDSFLVHLDLDLLWSIPGAGKNTNPVPSNHCTVIFLMIKSK